MSVAAEKVAELLALPVKDRAYLAHELFRSLDAAAEAEGEEELDEEWAQVIDRRTKEMEEGVKDSRSEDEMLRTLQAKVDAARRKTS
jgi:putative addiction module component (TIGR02574 family)